MLSRLDEYPTRSRRPTEADWGLTCATFAEVAIDYANIPLSETYQQHSAAAGLVMVVVVVCIGNSGFPRIPHSRNIFASEWYVRHSKRDA